jgi:4,5-dihydroxyphthalate decarboxylase
MGKLALTLACGDYEIMRALADGKVRPDGIDLLVLTRDRTRILRSARRDECDLTEFNLVGYLIDRLSDEGLTALPVFPHRRFRHGFVFVNSGSGITEPTDLRGRRVGIRGRVPAAAVWMRGILADFHDVPYDSVQWVDLFGIMGEPPDGSADAGGIAESNIRIDEMLLAGELDAIITPSFPRGFVTGDKRIRRLFSDYKQADLSYYEKTGIFPIMHAVVLSKDLVTAHPWMPASMAYAFEESKQAAYERVRNPRVLPLAFFQTAWEEQRDVLGSDPWEYGLGPANRRNLETIIRYTAEQGLIPSRPEIQEVFVPLDSDAFTGTPGF